MSAERSCFKSTAPFTVLHLKCLNPEKWYHSWSNILAEPNRDETCIKKRKTWYQGFYSIIFFSLHPEGRLSLEVSELHVQSSLRRRAPLSELTRRLEAKTLIGRQTVGWVRGLCSGDHWALGFIAGCSAWKPQPSRGRNRFFTTVSLTADSRYNKSGKVKVNSSDSSLRRE